MDEFKVNFNLFVVGKTFEDWLKTDDDDKIKKTKDKAQGTRFRNLIDEELRTIEDAALEANTKHLCYQCVHRVEEPPEG